MIRLLLVVVGLTACAGAAAQDGTVDVDNFVSPSGYRLLSYSALPVEQDTLGALRVLANGTVLYGVTVGGNFGSPVIVDLMSVDGGVAPAFFTQSGFSATSLASLTLEADGKVLVLVNDYTAPQNVGYLYRLHAAGGIDGTFGSAGLVTVPFNVGLANGIATAAEVLVQADGKILVAATIGPAPPTGMPYSSTYAMTVTRLLTDGQVDTAYGNSGTAVVTRFAEIAGSQPHEQLKHARLARDGGLLLAGMTDYFPGTAQPSRAAVAKLNTSGQTDAGFGNSGAVVLGTDFPSAKDLALTRASGFYLLSGYTLLRFDANGQRDFNFGVFGAAYLDVPDPAAGFGSTYTVRGAGAGLTVQNDGKIVVGGSVRLISDSMNHAMAYRFTPDGLPDPGYGTSSPGAFVGDLLDYYPAFSVDFGDGELIALQNNQTLLSGRVPTSGGGYNGFVYRLKVDEIFPSGFDSIPY